MDDKTAQKIRCRYCGAEPGQPCQNKLTSQPLKKFVAHTVRITDAKTITPLPRPPDEEDVF